MSKIGIKFVSGGKVYNVDTDAEIENDTTVVVESIRGMEIATTCALNKTEDGDEIKSVIRVATPEDLKKYEDLKKQESKVMKCTSELIAKYKLDMKLVDAYYTLDGSKVIINYVCENRVDFRDLVKELASILKVRIELRQIGIRDQAKKIGGIGFCGKECCCKQYLNDFDKVSIKMAKTQGLSLNPTKISGICGRLMCCLSFENDYYSEVSGKMPKINARVKTPEGEGTVVYNNLLKQLVTVKIETESDTKYVDVAPEDIVIVPKDIASNEKKSANQNSHKKENNQIKSDTNNSENTNKNTKDAPKEKLNKETKDLGQNNKKNFKKKHFKKNSGNNGKSNI